MKFGFVSASILAVIAMASPACLQGQSEPLQGVVLSRKDSSRLAGAFVRDLTTRRGVRTDLNGNFRIPRHGSMNVSVGRLGYLPDTLFVTEGSDSLVVFLSVAPILMDALAVSAEQSRIERFLNDAQASSSNFTKAEVLRTPSFLEADVLRTVQLMAGTVSKNDYTVGFNVRGGESDQNLIQMDGINVFNPSHLGGLFSTFDAAAVDNVEFIAGGFPAHYGGRLSSVLDIDISEGRRQGFGASGQVSLLSSKLLVDGPLPGRRGSFLVGARRTYADAVVGTFTRGTLPYYFADALAKLSYDIGENSSISVTSYWGRDNLDLGVADSRNPAEDIDLEFNWGNRLLGVNGNISVGNFLVKPHLSVSEFSTTLGFLPDIIRYDNFVQQLTARTIVEYQAFDSHQIRFGASVESFKMDYDLSSPSLAVNFLDQDYSPTVVSLHIDDQWHAGRLLLRPGVRADRVGEANFFGVSPRVSFKLFLNGNTAVTGSAGRYHQAIHSIRDQEQPFTIFEFWIGVDSVVPVARSDHLVLGVEKWIGTGHQITIEAYNKTFRNLVVPNRFQELKVVGDEFMVTQGRSWGLDLVVRRFVGNIKGFLAYSLTNAIRRTATSTFPPGHDRRHTFNIVMQTSGPLGSDLSVRWGFGSPLPFTSFIGEWNHRRYSAINNRFTDVGREPIGSELNGERYPTYSRLDISFKWKSRKWGGVLRPYLNIVNAYNRRNVFLYFFDFDDSPVTRTGVSQLPFVPTFGLEFEW